MTISELDTIARWATAKYPTESFDFATLALSCIWEELSDFPEPERIRLALMALTRPLGMPDHEIGRRLQE